MNIDDLSCQDRYLNEFNRQFLVHIQICHQIYFNIGYTFKHCGAPLAD